MKHYKTGKGQKRVFAPIAPKAALRAYAAISQDIIDNKHHDIEYQLHLLDSIVSDLEKNTGITCIL